MRTTQRKKQHCPGMGVEPTETIAVCFSEVDGRGGQPEAGPLCALTAEQQAGGRRGCDGSGMPYTLNPSQKF